MAKFKPGQSGNPGGRPRMPSDIRQARQLNQIELERVFNKLLYLDRNGLQEIIKSPSTPMLEIVAASILAQAAQKGDQQRLEFVLTRILGKPTEHIQINEFDELSDDELRKLVLENDSRIRELARAG